MIRAELIKLRTLRSTPVTLGLAAAVGAALSLLVGYTFREPSTSEHFDPVFPSFYGLTLAQIPLAVFAEIGRAHV